VDFGFGVSSLARALHDDFRIRVWGLGFSV
jgi:hypothetical protein